MKRIDSMVIAILLILVLLVYGNTFYSKIVNSFAETGRKINVVQVARV